MILQEYLEKIANERYVRQLDEQENVARTLPFFAAALAVLANVINYIRTSIPPFGKDYYSVGIYLIFLLLGLSSLYSIFTLWYAVRRREFIYPATESELAQYIQDLQKHYETLSLTPEQTDAAIISDVRQLLIEQHTRAAFHNRRNNDRRSTARASAATSLVAALGLAFILLVSIFVHDAIPGATNAGAAQPAARPTGTQSFDDG